MSATHVTKKSFQTDVLDVKGMPVLVDFWATWCGPCQMQGPIVDELAKTMAGKAKFAKVNVDEENELSSQYGIMSIPALKVFKDGRLVDELVGLHDKKQLIATLEKHL